MEATPMRMVTLAALVVLVVGPALAEGGRAAKQLFGNIAAPADLTPRPIGGYTRGCLAGAVALPPDGPNWQVMRLSRNRNWGHPILVEYLKKFSADMASDSRSGLLVGDLSQPRGGPMLSGHASHQSGLDADIWFLPMPDYTMSAEEREKRSAVSLLMTGRLSVDPRKWSDLYPRLLKRAVSYPEVARIFVSAAIKQKLCETAGSDRAWLRRIRPWFGHDDHFHVRLDCPPGVGGCKSQAPVGPGDGCSELAEWFKPPPPPPPKPAKPRPPPPELTLAELPAACTDVLNTGLAPGQASAIGVPLPRLRPQTN